MGLSRERQTVPEAELFNEEEENLDDLSFGQAFAKSRKKGLDVFEWKGNLFTTETKEEQDARLAEKKPAPQAQQVQEVTGSRDINQPSTVGGALGAIQDLGGVSPAVAQGFSDAIGMTTALVTLDEDSPLLPESVRQVPKFFTQALAEGKSRFGNLSDPRSDAFRHIIGSRNAALALGPVTALAAGFGHEMRNIKGSISQGDDLQRVLQIVTNSAADMFNNALGVISALTNDKDLSPEEQEKLLSQASLKGSFAGG